jgi:hypothetical protein
MRPAWAEDVIRSLPVHPEAAAAVRVECGPAEPIRQPLLCPHRGAIVEFCPTGCRNKDVYDCDRHERCTLLSCDYWPELPAPVVG